jgi:23S rRNA pseudouridine1911/1915/1917 synthase
MKKSSPKNDRWSGRHTSRKPRFPRELVVIYEDDAVVAVNKPAGLLAVPVEGSAMPSALSILDSELKQEKRRAYVVHRIDRFTSGVLLFAKSQRDREALIRQFLAHTPVREYLAVVRGRLAEKAGTLVQYFRRDGQFQKLSSARDSKAARAELRYKLERSLRESSLVRVELETGLQNQIRVQFSAIGHPVMGDRAAHCPCCSPRGAPAIYSSPHRRKCLHRLPGAAGFSGSPASVVANQAPAEVSASPKFLGELLVLQLAMNHCVTRNFLLLFSVPLGVVI